MMMVKISESLNITQARVGSKLWDSTWLVSVFFVHTLLKGFDSGWRSGRPFKKTRQIVWVSKARTSLQDPAQ